MQGSKPRKKSSKHHITPPKETHLISPQDPFFNLHKSQNSIEMPQILSLSSNVQFPKPTNTSNSPTRENASSLSHIARPATSREPKKIKLSLTSFNIRHENLNYQKRLEIMSSIEEFFSTQASINYSSAIESFISTHIKTTSVTFWIAVPSINLLYSPRTHYSTPIGQGIPGYVYLHKQRLSLSTPQSHASYLSELDGKVLNDKTGVIALPCLNALNSLEGILVIQKKLS